ncbi:hypothetical protein ACTFIU_000365 [Dictyostelium citrinum]
MVSYESEKKKFRTVVSIFNQGIETLDFICDRLCELLKDKKRKEYKEIRFIKSINLFWIIIWSIQPQQSQSITDLTRLDNSSPDQIKYLNHLIINQNGHNYMKKLSDVK